MRRLDELEAVLASLADFMTREEVDALLVSGDVFDSGAPIAEAERLVFRFLRRIGDTQTKTILIAGNHDSPARLHAWGGLAELAGVQVVARPRPADQGGVIRIDSKRGQRAVIAAVPFAPTRDLVSAASLAEDETTARQQYADGVRRIVEKLCDRFESGTINVLVAHTHVEGALLSGSEREVHVGEQWAATAQALPPNAHYVALGHIHKPQAIAAAPSPTQYAGSPMQLDFGEEGEDKSFVVIDAEPGRPAQVQRVPYAGAKRLRTVRTTLAELDARASELLDAGWLRITVPLDTPDPDLSKKVRALLPNALRVCVELPEVSIGVTERPPPGAPAQDLFAAHYRRRYGRDPEASLVTAFVELLMAQSMEE